MIWKMYICSTPIVSRTRRGIFGEEIESITSVMIEDMWSWDTIHACFLSSTWHIKSSGMFAGSCIGIVGLIMTLELLRRLTKEKDR